MIAESDEIERSRSDEMKLYLDSMEELYENSQLQNLELYDIASQLTNSFRSVTPEAILEDSRIIKILRYSIAPSISQMKCGQTIGLKTVGNFENSKIDKSSRAFKGLMAAAGPLSAFFANRLDHSRFLWLKENLDPDGLALATEFARKWTCSISSDQNAQTNYRNWRRNFQELRIENELVSLGYRKSSFSGVLHSYTDLSIGEYTREVRVMGKTRQKADLVVRSKHNHPGRLYLIEAKAVGVEIDSTKRIKECCDKANDWRSSIKLNSPGVIAVIGGYFTSVGLNSLRLSNVTPLWEHRINSLGILL